MKAKKHFQIFISSLIMISFFVFPLINVKIASAQSASSTISGYIQGLAPVITKLPGCKNVLENGTNSLFSGIKKLFSKSGKSTDSLTSSENLKSTVENYSDIYSSVEVYDKSANKKLDNQSSRLKAIEDKADKTKTAVENQDKNQNCLNAIGKAVAKILIDKLTLSTIEWIQTGNEGGPLFVQDPGKFFEDIGKAEILGFGMEIEDPDLYPFAKNFMQGVKNTYTNRFATNAQYSLDTLIAKQTPEFSSQTFSLDFTQGGWGAWEAMTQYPQNNPIGFNVMASSELQSRLEGTFQSSAQLAQQALTYGSGFLGQERCADPVGVTKEDNEKYLRGDTTGKRCNRWEYVTPGKLISEELVSAVQKKDNALLDVETLNDAVAAILDAVLSRLVQELHDPDTGLAYLDVDTSIQDGGYDPFGNNFQTRRDYTPNQIAASTWLAQHPDFDIRTDLSQALIDEQRIYKEKLEQQNKELNSTTDGEPYKIINTTTGETNAYGLMPTIYQLDYCIPGPHPEWEEEAQENLIGIQNKMGSLNFSDMTEAGWFQFVDWLTLGGLGTVVGLVNSYAFDCGSDSGSRASHTYMSQFNEMTHMGEESGIREDSNANLSFCSVQGFIIATDKAQAEYERVINKIYNLKYMPTSTKEARTFFEKLDEYNEIMSNNQATIDTLKGVITRLEQIKKEIDELNRQLANGEIEKDGDDGYEGKLTAWKNAFARISSNLYSGDDIAEVDNITKEIIDEKEYVYKNLIKSETGCETEVDNNNPNLYDWRIYASTRPDYPKPHLYSYPNRLSTKDPNLNNKPIDPFAKNTFTPYTQFANWSENCPKDWALDCFYMSGTIDTESPDKGGKGYFWEKALGIW